MGGDEKKNASIQYAASIRALVGYEMRVCACRSLATFRGVTEESFVELARAAYRDACSAIANCEGKIVAVEQDETESVKALARLREIAHQCHGGTISGALLEEWDALLGIDKHGPTCKWDVNHE